MNSYMHLWRFLDENGGEVGQYSVATGRETPPTLNHHVTAHDGNQLHPPFVIIATARAGLDSEYFTETTVRIRSTA